MEVEQCVIRHVRVKSQSEVISKLVVHEVFQFNLGSFSEGDEPDLVYLSDLVEVHA